MEYWLLTWECLCSFTEIWEHENHADDVQTRQTGKSWWMVSQMYHTIQSHKSITQLNHTGLDDITTKNGNLGQCFWMLQSNSGAYGYT